jgi:hypothetical protein
MALSKLQRQRIVKEFAVRHNGHYNPNLFLEEVRRQGKGHPAYAWFEWDEGKAASAYQLEQARAFARDLRVTFTVTEVNGGNRRVKVRESSMPMVISPLQGRQDGGGYVLVDPKDPAHLDEHCRQAAVALRAWLGRYSDAVKHIGQTTGQIEGLIEALEKRALLDVKAAS